MNKVNTKRNTKFRSLGCKFSMYTLLVGLGNPGKNYQNTRHNLGGRLVEKYVKKHGIKLSLKPSFKAKIGILKQQNIDLILAIPSTYMNLSGLTVSKIVNFYKIEPENIYIAHDDLDIGVGESKIQFDRGPAGHNGIKSIIEQLGNQQFWRIRIGIDHPTDSIDVEDYVLIPPTADQKPKIDQSIDKIVEDLDKILGL